jgi:hypothetical protein
MVLALALVVVFLLVGHALVARWAERSSYEEPERLTPEEWIALRDLNREIPPVLVDEPHGGFDSKPFLSAQRASVRECFERAEAEARLLREL